MLRAACRLAPRRPRLLLRRPAALRRLVPALVLGIAVAAAGCGPRDGGGTTAVSPAPPERIDNPALGIALVGARAAGFEVVANEGETLRLRRPAQGDEAEATLAYEASPPQAAGVNLVAAVNEQRAAIEARPDGKFLGQAQLMSPLGNAYSTRGSYPGDGGPRVEEIRIFAVHPYGDRLLSLTYRYPLPPGGSKTRVEQAMAALGLVEPLAAAAPEEGDAEPPDGGYR